MTDRILQHPWALCLKMSTGLVMKALEQLEELGDW